MKVDRCYILLGQFNRSSTSGGSDFYDIDLRDIMSSLYDKYTRFCIKLEAYHSRTANAATTTGDEVQFLHISGLNWLNGYDTNPLYPSSRVTAAMFFEHTLFWNGEFYRNMLYPANTATLMFSRQASSRVQLELFATTADSNTKLTSLFGSESPNYLFSITGVEDKYPIYRQPEVIEKTSQLVLNASKATNLEALRRAIRWRVDLSQVIDRNVYNKYNKFVLVTKMVQANNTYANFTAWFGSTALMSGLNWFSPSLKLNSRYSSGGGSTSWLNLYHQGAVTAVSLVEYANIDYSKETFIDNVFYKPASPVVDLTITFNRMYSLDLIGSSQAIEPFVWIFNILPVDD